MSIDLNDEKQIEHLLHQYMSDSFNRMNVLVSIISALGVSNIGSPGMVTIMAGYIGQILSRAKLNEKQREALLEQINQLILEDTTDNATTHMV